MDKKIKSMSAIILLAEGSPAAGTLTVEDIQDIISVPEKEMTEVLESVIPYMMKEEREGCFKHLSEMLVMANLPIPAWMERLRS